jgi:hypothetical protein
MLLLPVRILDAHREDYIDETLVFQTIEQGSIEPEYWFDYGHRGESNKYFERHNIAVEYGLTHWLMVDGRITFDHPQDQNTDLDSGRFEMRYRFGEEGDWPVDVAFSTEINTRRLEDGHYQYGVEPRLILSKDFSKLNVTLNVAEELAVNRGAPSLELASGARYDLTQLFRFGSEFKYDVHERSGSVIPQVWFAFPHDVTFKVGFSAALIITVRTLRGSRSRWNFSNCSVRSLHKLAQVFILVRRKRDDDDINGGDQEKPDRAREGEPIKLIDDEQREDDDGRGIVPKFLTEEPDDQP